MGLCQSESTREYTCVLVAYAPIKRSLFWARSFLNVQFLNLMELISQRAGHVNIRVGGNTQETAVLVDSLPGNAMITKYKNSTDSVRQALLLHSVLGLDVER